MRFKILLIIIPEIIVIAILTLFIFNKKIQPVDVFFIKNDYYSYPQKDNVKYYYELKPALGKINDLMPKPEWLSYKPVYQINKDGLNERFDYPTEKPKDTYRIVTLGDSFTFGLFVNVEDNWPEKLENLLNRNLKCSRLKKFEVINLAVGGYDLLYELERYKLKGQKYTPDVLLWFVKDEDFEWINEYLQPEIVAFEKLVKDKKMENNVSNWEQVWLKISKKYKKELSEKKILELQKKNLSLINDYFKNKLVILNLPKYSSNKNYSAMIEDLVKSRENSYFHILPDIIKQNAIFPESHPDKKGHQLIAQDLFNYLTKNNIISCN